MGSGQYGEVYKGEWFRDRGKTAGIPIAVKTLKVHFLRLFCHKQELWVVFLKSYGAVTEYLLSTYPIDDLSNLVPVHKIMICAGQLLTIDI